MCMLHVCVREWLVVNEVSIEPNRKLIRLKRWREGQMSSKRWFGWCVAKACGKPGEASRRQLSETKWVLRVLQ